jgi:hypothetical protein|tara:strand:- start:568 stop:822 length:255 start_codon:yes stop_codon:yes gene_type:complete
MMTADGFDEAIVGSITSYGRGETVLYSTQKILEIMMERDGMTEEDAIDFFHFNVIGSYNGDGMPAFLNDHVEPLEFDDNGIIFN